MEELSYAGCGESGFGGDVEGGGGEALWGRELNGEEEGQQELGFACAAGEVLV